MAWSISKCGASIRYRIGVISYVTPKHPGSLRSLGSIEYTSFSVLFSDHKAFISLKVGLLAQVPFDNGDAT